MGHTQSVQDHNWPLSHTLDTSGLEFPESSQCGSLLRALDEDDYEVIEGSLSFKRKSHSELWLAKTNSNTPQLLK